MFSEMLKIKVAELQECSPTEDNKREYQTKVGQFCWQPYLFHDDWVKNCVMYIVEGRGGG